MNTALVFVQIARHLYQVMTPKVTISAKEEDTDGRKTRKLYGVSLVVKKSSLLRRQNKVEEVVTQ